jgi:UDP:flavonoid glycosyltransferase YjiC (YdhE family)
MELKRRGHRVRVLTGQTFKQTVLAAGLEYLQTSAHEEYIAGLQHPDLWHPLRGYATVMAMVSRQLRRVFALLRQIVIPGQTLVIAPTLDLASRTLQEKTGLPVVTVHLQPIVLRTCHTLSAGLGATDLSFLPRWTKRLLWRAVDRWMLDPPLAGVLDEMRREVGLPPIRRLFDGWVHSPLLTLGLFPPWFAPPQPDWPPQLRLTGFPLFDGTSDEHLAPPLEAFLDAGAPPLVFTFGSAMVHGRKLFAAAAAAARSLGRRALLLTGHSEQIPDPLPAGMLHVDYAPLRRLLPRCAALIHHGGIGTLAAGLASGVPQLVMPLSHDQPDNAVRAARLGVARMLSPRRANASAMSQALGELLSSPAVAASCQQVARLCRQTDAVAQSCDLIEGAIAKV